MARQVTLQQCFEEIDAAILALEDGDLPLEESFKRYEAALRRLGQARQLLDQYQARFTELKAGAEPQAALDDAAEV